jgi:hypothetical protein
MHLKPLKGGPPAKIGEATYVEAVLLARMQRLHEQ